MSSYKVLIQYVKTDIQKRRKFTESAPERKTTGGYQDKKAGKKMQGAHFLKAFRGENVTKNEPQPRKTTEIREIKGLTFLVLIFLIFLFYSRYSEVAFPNFLHLVANIRHS